MNERDNIILNKLYRGTQSITDFCWDNIQTVPLLSLITRDEIEGIRKLITSPRYSGNNRLKMQGIDEVMDFRGFHRFAGGTNRLVYEHPNAPNAVFKVAIDSVGITDNPCEFYNQQFLKPYCTKIFECSPCGTLASVEKVDRITNFDEFMSIIDDYFYLISRMVYGRKLVMDDIGIDYFMNIGIRKGFGPVILDFPYLFEADGKKLLCNRRLDNGIICHGEIDAHPSFNYLVCNKCGTHYRARDLAKSPESSNILIEDEGAVRMKIRLVRDGKVESVFDTYKVSDHFEKEDKVEEQKTVSSDQIVVKCVRVPIETKKEEVVEKSNAVTRRNISSGEEIKEDNSIYKNRRVVKISFGEAAAQQEINTVITETTEDDSDNNLGIKVNCVRKPIYNNKKFNKNTNTQKRTYQKPEAKDIPQINPILNKLESVASGDNKIKNVVTEKSNENITIATNPIDEMESLNDVKIDDATDKAVDIIVNAAFNNPKEFKEALAQMSSNENTIEKPIEEKVESVVKETPVVEEEKAETSESIEETKEEEVVNEKVIVNNTRFSTSEEDNAETVYSDSDDSQSDEEEEEDIEETESEDALGDEESSASKEEEEAEIDPAAKALEDLMATSRKKSLDGII